MRSPGGRYLGGIIGQTKASRTARTPWPVHGMQVKMRQEIGAGIAAHREAMTTIQLSPSQSARRSAQIRQGRHPPGPRSRRAPQDRRAASPAPSDRDNDRAPRIGWFRRRRSARRRSRPFAASTRWSGGRRGRCHAPLRPQDQRLASAVRAAASFRPSRLRSRDRPAGRAAAMRRTGCGRCSPDTRK